MSFFPARPILLLPAPATAEPVPPEPDGTPSVPADPAPQLVELQAAFEAHYPALLRFCRVESVGYVLCSHVAAAEGAAVRFSLGTIWVLLRVRSDGQVGPGWRPLSARAVAYLLTRHLPVRDRRALAGGPRSEEARRWGLKRAARAK